MVRVCFIGGFGRSGTTLLERMLAQATGACALGEVVWVWQRGVLRDEKCGCGQRFSSCEFWQAIGERAFGGWQAADARIVDDLRTSVDRMRHIPALLADGARRRRALVYSEYLAEIYSAAQHVSGAPAVIDSSKHSSLAFALRLNPRLDLKVVHAVRDSRGVAYSWTKMMARPEAQDPSALMYTYAPWRSAALWDAHNLAFTLLATTGVSIRRLMYEQLLADPVATICDLAGYLGTSTDVLSIFLDARTVKLDTTHQISGNPMRLNAGEIVLREDDAWRTSLEPRSRRAVSALTLPLLAGYGYLRSRAAES